MFYNSRQLIGFLKIANNYFVSSSVKSRANSCGWNPRWNKSMLCHKVKCANLKFYNVFGSTTRYVTIRCARLSPRNSVISVYSGTWEPVYYGIDYRLTNQRCPDYQGVLIFQVSLYDKAPFGTIARCPDYAGVHIFKCPD